MRNVFFLLSSASRNLLVINHQMKVMRVMMKKRKQVHDDVVQVKKIWMTKVATNRIIQIMKVRIKIEDPFLLLFIFFCLSLPFVDVENKTKTKMMSLSLIVSLCTIICLSYPVFPLCPARTNAAAICLFVFN